MVILFIYAYQLIPHTSELVKRMQGLPTDHATHTSEFVVRECKACQVILLLTRQIMS